jgi:hypothetical protein
MDMYIFNGDLRRIGGKAFKFFLDPAETVIQITKTGIELCDHFLGWIWSTAFFIAKPGAHGLDVLPRVQKSTWSWSSWDILRLEIMP